MMEKNAIFSYFPENFAHKSVSEPFIAYIMSRYLGIGIEMWKQGNPDKFEPDYAVDKEYYEFTLASDKGKRNLIRRLQMATYSSTNIVKDAWDCIQTSLESKMKKHYSVSNVSVCILCLIDFNEAFIQNDGSMSTDLFVLFHDQIFAELKQEYVDKGELCNIFILFPFSNETWWVMDVNERSVIPVRLSEAEIRSGQYPFFSKNMDYYNYFSSHM